jgi:hypothetical protein
MGRRARFRGAKATPKSLEKDLLDKSKKLAEDPGILMPKCTRECGRCALKKSLVKMQKVSQRRYDPKKLEFSMKWGDQLVRAYAATISLHLAGKVPYLAATRTPMGEVSFAVRGKVDKNMLIGVQHYDHPELRLLALWSVAEKRGLHIYSTESGAVCSPDGPKPPAEYVDEVLSLLPYDIDDSGCCPHGRDAPGLKVRWKGAGTELSICPACAGEVNTVHVLASRVAARDPTDDFEVEVLTDLKCTSDCPDCRVKDASRLPKDLLKRYLKGEMGDAVLLKEEDKARTEAVKDLGQEVYMIGGQCFGSDRKKFLETLRGSDAEKEAISKLISSNRMSVLSRTDQAANLISDLWAEHKDELLAAVASPEVVKKVLAERSELTPAQTVVEAKREEGYKAIEAALPSFGKLGPVGLYADRLGRTFKTEGKEAALRQVEKTKGSDHKLRSVSFAFISALGEGQTKSWQFTREEMDFGAYLAPFAKRVLDESGDAYADALKVLLEASGSNEKLETA